MLVNENQAYNLDKLVKQTKESSEIISNSLKTIYSRLESNSIVEKLEMDGLNLINEDGDYLNSDQILKLLSEKWHSFSLEDKEKISTIVAGQYNISKFLNLMN